MKRVATLGVTASVVLFLSLFLQFSQIAYSEEECPKCTEAPTTDCKSGDTPPLNGGPSCLCVQEALLPGCVLKPCEGVPHGEFCDSSQGYGGEEERNNAFSHKCTGATDDCECCTGYPKDCTDENNENPPAWGGEACSCTASVPAPGCVLKPCMRETDIFCVCNRKNSVLCFDSGCPGNQNATLTGDCKPGDGEDSGDDGGSCGAPVKISVSIDINVSVGNSTQTVTAVLK